MSIKIKLKGQDARNLLTENEPAAVVRGGKELMGENPQSRQAEGKNKNENSDITKKVKKTLTLPEPEARIIQGYDIVKPVNRERKDDSPDQARMLNARTRDMRTCLGRGKTSIVEVD